MATATNLTLLSTAKSNLDRCATAGSKLVEARGLILDLGLTALVPTLDKVLAGLKVAQAPLQAEVGRCQAAVLADSLPTVPVKATVPVVAPAVVPVVTAAMVLAQGINAVQKQAKAAGIATANMSIATLADAIVAKLAKAPAPVVVATATVKPTCGYPTAAGTPCTRPVSDVGGNCRQHMDSPPVMVQKVAAKVEPKPATVRTVTVDVVANVENMDHGTLVGIMAQLSVEQLRTMASMLTEKELVVAIQGHSKTIR